LLPEPVNVPWPESLEAAYDASSVKVPVCVAVAMTVHVPSACVVQLPDVPEAGAPLTDTRCAPVAAALLSENVTVWPAYPTGPLPVLRVSVMVNVWLVPSAFVALAGDTDRP
jgi:hypothetical protein